MSKNVDLESNPFMKISAAHIGELTEIVEQCRERDRALRKLPVDSDRQYLDISLEVARNNQTRIMALTEIHNAKMNLLMMQQRQVEQDMMMAAHGIVQPRP